MEHATELPTFSAKHTFGPRAQPQQWAADVWYKGAISLSIVFLCGLPSDTRSRLDLQFMTNCCLCVVLLCMNKKGTTCFGALRHFYASFYFSKTPRANC